MTRPTTSNKPAESSSVREKLLAAIVAAEELFPKATFDEETLLGTFRKLVRTLNIHTLVALIVADGTAVTVKAIEVGSYRTPTPIVLKETLLSRLEGQHLPLLNQESVKQLRLEPGPVFTQNGSKFLRFFSPADNENATLAIRVLNLLFAGPSIFVPLWVAGELHGLVGFSSTGLNQRDAAPFATLCGYLSTSLELTRSAGDVDFIAGKATRSDQDRSDSSYPTGLQQALGRVLADLSRPLYFDRASIFVQEGSTLRLVAVSGGGEGKHIFKHAPVLPVTIATSLQRTQKPLIVHRDRPLADPELPNPPDEVYSWIVTPLIVREQVVGYLSLENHAPLLLAENQIAVIQAFANQAAMTIENIRLVEETLRLLHSRRREAGRLQQVLDLVPDGILLLDNENRVLMHNQAGGAYLAQLSGVRPGDTLSSLGEESVEGLFESQREWLEARSIGKKHVFEISAQPILSDGEQDGWLIILRNVTSERNKQRYLQAQDRLSTVGQLAAGIAHDFNNMLAVISLYSQLVSRVPDLAKSDRQRLSTVQKETERAALLLNQILDFSRQSIVQLKPIELSAYLREMGASLTRTLSANVEVTIQSPTDGLHINGDSTRLRKVFENLAENAMQSMPDGGHFAIRAEAIVLEPSDPFPLPDMSAGQWIKIEVSDNGPAADPDELLRFFEPFYRPDGADRGTGLGLAQVYGIVKQHRGFIDVRSSPGQGTTFTIYLPQIQLVEEMAVQSTAPFEQLGQGETILVVEDDRPTLEALSEILTVLNYRVLTARDGEEALACFEDGEHIDLVVSDMVMPVMGGAILYAALKEKNRDIKMILVTGYPIDEQADGFAERGISAFIQKPLRIQEISAAIRKALS